jgi:Kef-type K+ transport system membrane component KefB
MSIGFIFLQLAVVLASCHVAGFLFERYLRQPRVVGEMVAGVMLGPSLLGAIAPALQSRLFPSASLGMLQVISQIGICLYMFGVGLEFRVDFVKARVKAAVAIFTSGIVVPFVLAACICPVLLKIDGLFSSRTSLFEATLFIGAAVSITAFPTLARIITERGLAGTRLGSLALSAGAIDDLAAWCILAYVLGLTNGKGAGPMLALGGTILYVLVLRFVVRPLVGSWRVQAHQPELTSRQLAAVMTLLVLAGGFTDWIGVHAAFGGFLLGAFMPGDKLKADLFKRVEGLASTLLVPVFFAMTGLNTDLRMMLDSPLMAAVAVVILIVSIAGKGVACWAAARWTGEDRSDSLALGGLMNTRGLMELLIANIGLQAGILKRPLFSMLVLMAIVTTFMAAPILRWALQVRRTPLRVATSFSTTG